MEQTQEKQIQMKALKYEFNDKEIVELSTNLAAALNKKWEVEQEKKSSAAGFTAQIAEADEEISRLTYLVSQKYETREVECEMQFHHPSQNLKTYTNPFNGKEVTEKMTEWDHNLFNQPPTEQGSEEASKKDKGNKKKDDETF